MFYDVICVCVYFVNSMLCEGGFGVIRKECLSPPLYDLHKHFIGGLEAEEEAGRQDMIYNHKTLER